MVDTELNEVGVLYCLHGPVHHRIDRIGGYHRTDTSPFIFRALHVSEVAAKPFKCHSVTFSMQVDGARILVTGGAGFIGSHLVGALLQRGAKEVLVIDDLSTGSLENLNPLPEERVTLYDMDVRDATSREFRKVDGVVHLAADVSVAASMKDPWATFDANVRGTLAVLEDAADAGITSFVFASSAAVYGDTPPPLSEDSPVRPLSPYGTSKLAAESLVRMFGLERGLMGISLRLFNVYGPRQRADSEYAAVVPAFVSAGLAGESMKVHGDGTQTRELVYVSDVCDAFVTALERTADYPGRAFNIAPGAPVTVNDLAMAVNASLDDPVAVKHGPPRPGDIQESKADVGSAKKCLEFVARTTLEEGLRATIEAEKEKVYIAETTIE